MKKCWALIFVLLLICLPSFAGNNEGTRTYEDYIFILVHGIRSDSGIFTGQKGFGDLKKYLEENLGLHGRVFSYTFKEINGRNTLAAEEFGDRTYHNTVPEMNGLCWLEKAKKQFESDPQNVKKPTPSKYIIIAHSMGGLAVRSYIYSEKVFGPGKGFYQDDIAKVVFIAPPLLGSDMVVSSWKLQNEIMTSGVSFAGDAAHMAGDFFSKKGIGEGFDVGKMINGFINGTLDDPMGLYMLAAWITTADIYGDVTIKELFGLNTLKPIYGGMWEMLPHSGLVMTLKDAELSDPTKEPAYSIVYGRGVPVFDAYSSLSVGGVKWLNDESTKKAFADDAAIRGSDYFDPAGRLYPNLFSQFVSLDYKWLTLAHPNFWSLPTAQAKMMSFLQANAVNYGYYTNDGDGMVPTYSAKGEGIKHLKNANKYEKVFKTPAVDDYFSGEFVAEIAAVESIIAIASSLTGTPPYYYWPLRFLVALRIVDVTLSNGESLRSDLKAHGKILEQTDLIRTAILDTAAVCTVTDLQTTIEATISEEAATLTFSVSSPEAGYHSIKAKGLTEDRVYRGLSAMAVPATINNDRKYMTMITLTKAPDRITGKLNYLVPKLMKSFEYSFNFAAWKPIEGVNPETGEFVIDNLPFAEGQNVLAIRAENAVGVKSHQLLKIVLNTIPLLSSKFQPMSGQYISDNEPNISVEFNKSEYTGDYESEKITIKEMLINGVTVEAQTESKMASYHPWAKASYKASALPEGEHTVVVRAESNVGVSQGIWSFYVDRSPPTISMEALAPYSARSPTTIRFNVSDEVSPNLLAVRCDLYSTNNSQLTTDNFIMNIATAESLSKGENFFSWGGPGVGAVPDGSYKIKIKAFDLAGNQAVAEQLITIDSTPPTITGVDVSPNPMTSKTTELGLTARVSEKSTVVIKLNNLSNNTVTAYLAQSSVVASGASESLVGSYSWKYDQAFTKGPEDGIYRVEVVAKDEAGNESAPRTLEAIRIDRTPPEIYGQTTVPYVLSNIGANAYKTTLSYNIMSNDKFPMSNEGFKTKIKIYNTNTGKLVETIENAPGAAVSENRIPWNGSGQPKGAYRLQIVAEDDVGNIGAAYASCVKDGVAPEISYPAEDNVSVSGTISIRGTAIDPDWTNDKPFKRYSVYYKKAGGERESVFVEVPPSNRDPKDPKNVSVRPLQNNSTLAYLYTNNLENGEYTIQVVVEEEGGESLAATRMIQVENDTAGESSASTPYTKLNQLPKSIEFKADDSVKLPISFINSVKPANVYVEIVEPRLSASGSTGEVVFFKYLPNIAGAPFTGKPDYAPGRDLGYFIWLDGSGYHLRWSADGSNHKYTGSILAVGGTIDTPLPLGEGTGVRVAGNLISWDITRSGAEGGVDFTVKSGQLMTSAKLDEDPASPSIYADKVYLGASKYGQQDLPIIIDVASQSLVDVSSLGKSAADSSKAQPPQEVLWNGKYDTGGFVDDGAYIVRVRGEGVDGRGVSTDETIVNVKTPFEFALAESSPTNKEFSTLGAPDRVSVSYKVNKDSIVNAAVYDSGGNFVARLAKGEEILGSNNSSSLSWRGNYPEADSTQVKNGGQYKIVLNVTAKDGSGSQQETINGISITSFTPDDSVKLAPIGEETSLNGETVRLAKGESPFFLEAKATGKYYPPRDFALTLSATGEQNLTAYPYVPFAGLMHRGFNKVRITAKTGAQGVYAASKWELFHWVRDGDTDFSNINRTSKDVTLTADSASFELSDSARSDDLFGASTAVISQPGRALVKLEIPITFCAQDDGTFVLDTFTIKNEDFYDGTQEVRTRSSDKGIFNITFEKNPTPILYVPVNWGGKILQAQVNNEYNHKEGEFNYRYRVRVQLASPIAYSRLTNRFVPWVGFVGSKNKLAKDFSGYLTDINKGLGFPGKAFFMDPEAKPDKPYLSTSEVATRLAGMSWRDRAEEIRRMANEANLLGYKDSLASTSGYNDYLDDEYFEFIPITSPDQSNNKPGGFVYTRNSPIVTAATDLVYSRDGSNGLKSFFSVPWPWDEAAFSNREGTEKTKKTEFEKNPQKYSGITKDGTFWEFDTTELNQKRIEPKTSKIIAGRMIFNKLENESNWTTTESFGQLLPVPDYVNSPRYLALSDDPNLGISPDKGDKNGSPKVADLTAPVEWSTADDLNLTPTNSLVASGPLLFNETQFSSRKQVGVATLYPLNKNDSQSSNAFKYTFLVKDPFGRCPDSPLDNPSLVLTSWSVEVKDKTGLANKDIVIEKVETTSDRGSRAHWQNDNIQLELKLDATEASYVEILGEAPGPYELSYFDGKSWKNIAATYENKSTAGRLAWWNVARLNGKYTVLLRSNGYIAAQDISIGTVVGNGSSGEADSTYRRAQLKFPAGAFGKDQLVTITPVSMNELYIRNRPIILTTGPIVEIKPSPWKFTVSSSEVVDQRPTLKFVYTFDELKELKVWDGKGAPEGIPWNIHQVTSSGDLQIIGGNRQEIENNNGEDQYAFYAPLDHFSTYALLPGKISLSAPLVFADRDITNKNSATLYGTAEPESVLNVYVSTESYSPSPSGRGGEGVRVGTVASDGVFRFENIPLLQEGKNYIYVTSHPAGNDEVVTWSDVAITRDTLPPSAEASANLYAFSPNRDGKYDTVEYRLKTNENGKLYFSVTKDGGLVFNRELSAEAFKENKINWDGDKLPDGEYQWAVYSIDEAGNISNNVAGQTISDTTPPSILTLIADPNPFTPNDDVTKDTTNFSYKLSEPAYVNLNIYRDDGQLFRSHEGPTGNFAYATHPRGMSSASAGEFVWDGRGSRYELLGGTYSYSIQAEDWVGNAVSSETKTIIVDRAPTLIPYAYAEPDPFAPVNPNNSFTEIKYFLSRDNLLVRAAVVGLEGKTLKTLVNNETQNKGEHSARWYGDFASGYAGPTAATDKYRVADGSYEFKIYANDPAEPGTLTAEVGNTVLVDNVPPQIMIKDLKIDYAKKEAALYYSIPENASVEAAVYSKSGDLLAMLVSGETQTAGEHTINYPLQVSGESYFKIVATDRAWNRAEKTSTIFAALPNQFAITSLAAAPAVFTPNGDGRSDLTKSTYTISGGEPPYMTTLAILAPAGSTAKYLTQDEEQGPGNYSFYWDGQNEAKRIAADGYYQAVLTAVDKSGLRLERRADLTLAAARPTVEIAVGLAAFSPNGDGVKDKVAINYKIGYPSAYLTGEALVKIELLNGSSEAIWSKVFNQTAGSYSYEWDGKLSNGLWPEAGEYYLRISAEDPLGSIAVPQTLIITADNQAPTITAFPLVDNLFSPPKGEVAISYSLSEKGCLSALVSNQEGSIVRTIIANEPKEAYLISASGLRALAIPTVNWDGRDDAGAMVADGIYRIDLQVTDEAGNSAGEQLTVEADSTEPSVPIIFPLPAQTNQMNLTVSGTAEPRSLVEITVANNDQLTGTYEVQADEQGSFAALVNLSLGPNQIWAEGIDPAGNVSDWSPTREVRLETDSPVISGLSVSPGIAAAGPTLINFIVSETLGTDPVVKVNDQAAQKVSSGESLSYSYQYLVTPDERQGLATIEITVQDLAGNSSTVQDLDRLKIDTLPPAVSNFGLNPKYAKEATKINLDFTVSEILSGDPKVTLNGLAGPVSLESVNGFNYSYSYVISDVDPDGTTPASIEVTDLAGNVNLFTQSVVEGFIVDKTSPEVTSVTVTPNPASTPSVSGQVSIRFNVSEPLKEAPKVYVTQNGAAPQLATVSGSYEAKYGVIAGYDGLAQITLEVTDLAGNINLFNTSFNVDTTNPVFSGLNCEIAGNPGFEKFARESSTATIAFTVSEPLKFNPQVKVNEGTAPINRGRFPGLSEETYEYKYIVSSADQNGSALISISGYDLAGNEGTAETNSSAESFVIDLQEPTAAIASPEIPGGIVSNWSFSTNANPDGTDRPRSTTFYYTLAEPSRVTVKVYKVGDNQANYVKEDFNAGNSAATLIDGDWQNAGKETIVWDGAGNVGPGKYAFIVEGRDRAGNLTLKKVGGTVWVQNNVLTLREPEQYINNNPEPHYISPNGNSLDPAQKRAKLYFMIDLALDPRQTSAPERIEAATVMARTKAVGKYSVKVYADSALTNLIRTVASDTTAESGTLTDEDWDGKNDAGQYAANGTYWLAVEARDYAGEEAEQNLLKRVVVVDNAPPQVANLAAAPYYFSPGNTESSIKTTTLTYEVADDSGQARVTVNVLKDVKVVGTLLSMATKESGAYSLVWEGKAGSDYAGSANGSNYTDGTYTLAVSAVDQAGNSAAAQERAVFVDTTGPNAPSLSSGAAQYPAWTSTETISVSWNTPGDAGSGLSRYLISTDGGAWSGIGSNPSWEGILTDGDSRTVDIRAVDAIGNLGAASRLTFRIDAAAPYFSSGPSISHLSENTWSTHSSPYFTFAAADATSGIDAARGYIDQSDQGPVLSGWHPVLSDGPHTVKLRIYDIAGNYLDSATSALKIDSTAPNAPAVSASHTPAGVWSNHNSPYLSWGDPGDGVGSGISYYRGYLDSIDQGNVSSGWHPTLAEGTHTIVIRAVDGVGLTRDSTTMTFMIDTISPTISAPPSKTFNPYADGGVRVDFPASDPSPSSGFPASNLSAAIKYNSNTVKTLSGVDDGAGNYHVIWDGKNNSNDYENEGDYALEITASDAAGNSAPLKTSALYLRNDQRLTNIEFPNATGAVVIIDGNYLRVRFRANTGYKQIDVSSNDGNFARDIVGKVPRPGSAYAYNSVVLAAVKFGNIWHRLRTNDGIGLYYSRSSDNVNWGPEATIVGPTIHPIWLVAPNELKPMAQAANGDLYVVWTDSRNGQSEVFFQKIPANFAPITGSRVGAQSLKGGAATSALESPTLLSPSNDDQKGASLRPTFEWRHRTGGTASYQLDVAKNDSFSIDHQAFNRSANTGSHDQKEQGLYHYSFAIHEFDPGLDRTTYYWQVTALSTNEAATSEIWSFMIQPDLTLTDITNYPNPFNPNNERTKVRYRLGADADSVKIRIYDIVGGLVTELDGTTNGEQANIWQKFNDVEWDGRNGRGDLVLNGIYPFEVVAKLGDKSLSGRGKIAVLK